MDSHANTSKDPAQARRLVTLTNIADSKEFYGKQARIAVAKATPPAGTKENGKQTGRERK